MNISESVIVYLRPPSCLPPDGCAIQGEKAEGAVCLESEGEVGDGAQELDG